MIAIRHAGSAVQVRADLLVNVRVSVLHSQHHTTPHQRDKHHCNHHRNHHRTGHRHDEQNDQISRELNAFLQSSDLYPDDLELLRIEANKFGFRVRGVI